VQRIPALLLDFTGVNYIDSSGLATLIEYYQSSRTYDGKMSVCTVFDGERFANSDGEGCWSFQMRD
jgi:anti-sigma B factor antagonist